MLGEMIRRYSLMMGTAHLLPSRWLMFYYYRKGLALVEHATDKTVLPYLHVASFIYSLGNAEWDAAAKYLDLGLESSETYGNYLVKESALLLKTDMHYRAGDIAAFDASRQAIESWHRQHATVLLRLYTLFWDHNHALYSGDLDSALAVSEQMAALPESGTNPQSRVVIEASLAVGYALKGDFEKAVPMPNVQPSI